MIAMKPGIWSYYASKYNKLHVKKYFKEIRNAMTVQEEFDKTSKGNPINETGRINLFETQLA